MTREEQIHNEASNYGYSIAGGELRRPAISKAFLEGAKWADENPKSPWISVEEGLPEVNQQVYAAMPNMCGVEYATIEYLGDNRWSQDDGEYTYKFSGCVTYWMPIPELPK